MKLDTPFAHLHKRLIQASGIWLAHQGGEVRSGGLTVEEAAGLSAWFYVQMYLSVAITGVCTFTPTYPEDHWSICINMYVSTRSCRHLDLISPGIYSSGKEKEIEDGSLAHHYIFFNAPNWPIISYDSRMIYGFVYYGISRFAKIIGTGIESPRSYKLIILPFREKSKSNLVRDIKSQYLIHWPGIS